MGKFLRACAALILSAVAVLGSCGPAVAGSSPPLLNGASQFPAPAVKPQPSASNGANNATMPVSTVLAGQDLSNGGANLWSEVPVNVLNSWTLVLRGTLDDTAGGILVGSATFAYPQLANCFVAACTSATDRLIRITGPNVSSTAKYNGEVQIEMSDGGTAFWIPPATVDQNATSCPGSGSTFCHTGIVMLPGQKYSLIITQYGADAGAAAGLVSISALDQNGNHLPGSPVVSTATNQSSAAAGFYYSAAATLRTRAAIGSLWRWLGTQFNSGSPLGSAGPFDLAGMLYGVPPNTAATPTLSFLQSLSGNGNDFVTAATAAGLTIQGLYQPDATGAWKHNPAATVTGDSLALGAGSVPASPLMPPPCIQLWSAGPNQVYSVEPGMTGAGATGTVLFKISGANKAACGFAPGPLVAKVFSGSTLLAQATAKPAADGTVIIKVSGVPAGGWYTRQVYPKASPKYVVNSLDPAGVGIVGIMAGQSQRCDFMNNNSSVAMAAAKAVASAMLVTDPPAGATKSPTNTSTYAHTWMRLLNSTSVPGTSAAISLLGDGATTFMNDIDSLSGGWPVALFQACKSGTPVDAWLYDYQPDTSTLVATGSNTIFSGSASNTGISDVPALVPAALGATPTATSTFQHAILAGTLVIKDSSGLQIAHDDPNATNCNAGVAPGLVADNGKTITACTLIYERNTPTTWPGLSVTFSSDPRTGNTGSVTTSFTSIQATQAGSYATYNFYNNFGTFGLASNPQSGLIVNNMAHMAGPPTFLALEQCSSNAGDVSSNFASNTSGMDNNSAKWDYVLKQKFPTFWWWDANKTKIIIGGFTRDTLNTYSNTTGCKAWESAGATGVGHGYASGGNYLFGGSQYDTSPVTSSATTGGPHPDGTAFGIQLVAHRLAQNVWTIQGGGTVAEPTITAAAFGVDKQHITITLSGLSQLATCGGTRSGGTTPPTGTCTVTTANGTVVKGIMIGCCNATAGSASYRGYDGYQEMLGGTATDFDIPPQSSTCTIASATTISCVATGGQTWVSGQTWVLYAGGNPMSRFAGVVNYAVTAGSGYTANASVTETATGGSCTTAPQVRVTVSAGGALSTATPVRLGAGCATAPTVPLTGLGAGTGGVVTATPTSNANDNDDVASMIYANDNKGNGTLLGGAAITPGTPVAPMLTPLAVTG